MAARAPAAAKRESVQMSIQAIITRFSVPEVIGGPRAPMRPR